MVYYGIGIVKYSVGCVPFWIEVVRFAADRGIVIIPEIDVPGHCYAAIRALPELLASGSLAGQRSGKYRSVQGFAGHRGGRVDIIPGSDYHYMYTLYVINVYMYIYTHTYGCMHVCIYTYIYIYTHTYIHTYIHMCVCNVFICSLSIRYTTYVMSS